MALQQLTADVLAEATGRRQRLDAIAPGGGGPAGNARLTAATGLVLLVLFLAELVTLLDVTGLIGWHVAIGVLLVPPALLKTASTGWRVVRYYGGDRDYRASGPPPMLLRLLGPLVVLSTLGLLGSGLALIALGPEASRYALIQALGQRVDAVTVHQAFFACWAVATGLHVLARLVPAVALAVRRSAVPGGRRRLAAIALTVIVAAITAALLLGTAAAWAHAGRPPALRSAPGALDRAGHTVPGACARGAVAGQLDTRHPATRRVLRPGCAAPERRSGSGRALTFDVEKLT